MPEVTTIVFSGGASERTPPTVQEFRGGALCISDVVIDDHVSYAQHSLGHLLHVPLAAAISGRGAALRFTPADREHRGRTGRGAITGLQLGFEPWFVEEACEQPFRAGRFATSDRNDAKSAIAAKTVAALGMLPAHDRILFDTMLLALARQLGRSYGNVERRRDDGWLHPRALSRVIDRLRSHEGPSIRLHDLAAEAGLGSSAFIRAFRGSVGLTPAAFAQRMRLGDAADLLRSTELPIAEIAARCGFCSPSHLASAFRARHGITPGQWRSGTNINKSA